MAIGAHELLLIIRAQNQASGLLSRVGRDMRRLQNMRDLDMQRSRIANQMAQTMLSLQAKQAKIMSVVSETGKANLANQKAEYAVFARQMNLVNRLNALEIRRTAIEKAGVNLEVQRLRIQQQQLNIESSLEKIEARRQAVGVQASRIGTSLIRNSVQQMQLDRQSFSLATQLMQRRLAVSKLEERVAKAGRDAATGRFAAVSPALQTELEIARRRVIETQMAQAEIPGRVSVLSGARADLTKQIPGLKAQLASLEKSEASLAISTAALEEREKALDITMRNLQARMMAVVGTEEELDIALANTEKELQAVRAAWLEQTAAAEAAAKGIQIDTEKLRMLNIQLAETDALIAGQKSERMALITQTIGHFGRVMTAAGLIGVAAFGAMAASAAKFQQEATRAATQTGKVGSGANVVIANASKIEKAILGVMTVIPANQGDLTDALYNIYSSMNVSLGGGIKLLKLFGQVWVAGGMQGSIQDVSDALITLANNWHINSNNMTAFRRIAASTLATVRFGRLTVEQYTSTMNQLAPAFHGAHQSIQEMNGAIAFLTKLLPSQRVSAAGIARMMEQLQRFAAAPKPGFEKLAKQITTTTGNLKPLHDVIGIILQDMPQLQKSGIDVTNFFKTVSGAQGTVQARRAFQAFIAGYAQYTDTLHKTTSDQNELNRSIKAMERSTGVRWQQFVNDMRVLGLTLGEAVLPAMLKLVQPLIDLAKWFNKQSDATKKDIGQLLALAAAVTLLVGAMASLGALLARIPAGLSAFFAAIGLGGKTAEGTITKVGKLRLALLGLARLSIPTLIIGYTLKSIGEKTAESPGGTQHLQYPGGLFGDILKAGGGLEYLVNRYIKGEDRSKARQNVVKDIQNTFEPFRMGIKIETTLTKKQIDAYGKALQTLYAFFRGDPSSPMGRHMTRKQAEDILKSYYPQLDDKVFDALLKRARQNYQKLRALAQQSQFTPALRQANFGAIPLSSRGDTTAALTNVQFLAAAAKAAQLDMAKSTAPDAASYQKAWKAYDSFVKTTTNGMTKDMKKQWDDIVQFIESNMPQAFEPLSKKVLSMIPQAYRLQQALANAANVNEWQKASVKLDAFQRKLAKILDPTKLKEFQDALAAFANFPTATKPLATIVAMQKQVTALHDAAVAAGAASPLWDKYFAAQKELNKVATPDQLSAASDILQAQGEEAKYSTEQILKMAQALEVLREAASLKPGDLALQQKLQDAITNYQKAATPTQQAVVQPSIDAQAAAFAARPKVPQQTITNLVLQSRALQKIAEASQPGPKQVAAWVRYFAIVDKLAKLAVGHQEDIGNAIADAMGGVSKLTLKQAVAMSRQLIRLQEIASKAPTIANWQRYFALQKKYAAEASDAIQQQADAIAQAQADAQKAAQKQAQDDAQQALQAYVDHLNEIRDAAIEKARQAVDTATSTLRQVLDDAKSQYQSFLGTLGQGPFMQSAYMQNRLKYGFQPRPQDYLKDVQQATKQAKTFATSLDRVRARAEKVVGPKTAQALVSQLAALGPEAQKMITAYMQMSPDQFNQLVTAFQKGQEAADKYAKQQLKEQIKVWESFGKNVAQAIITGIKSQTSQFDDYITNLVKSLFPGLAATAKQKTSGEGGGYRAGTAGSGGRTTSTLPDSSPYSPNYTRWYNQHYNWHGTGYPEAQAKALGLGGYRTIYETAKITQNKAPVHNVTYNIHPTQKGEGLETMLRRSYFHYRSHMRTII